MAPAIPPAVTTAATVHASPAVTPAVSPPLHVRQIIEAGGGSRRKLEDRCRLGSSGPARKNQTCNSDRKYCAQHMCISLNACFIVARLNDWINQKQDQPFLEWSLSEELDGRDAGITVCTLLAQSRHTELHCTCPLLGVQRTSLSHRKMSAIDPKRTFLSR